VIYLVRHGQTKWSITGQHTGTTDIPLTENGIAEAKLLRSYLNNISFSKVLSSPKTRALDTAFNAGYENVDIEPLLVEWDYGDTEGKTTEQMRQIYPGWSLFKNGVENGETLSQVYVRAQKVIGLVEQYEKENVLMFAHGHILRLIGAAWINCDASLASQLVLSPCSISILGYEHETRAILKWNYTID
jgi:probable phosphoglycerate mutase